MKTLKILHCADIHLGEYPGPVINGQNARMQDIISCMRTIREQAFIEQVDLIVVAGDLTNKSKLWGDEALRETQIIGEWLTELSQVAPVLALFGTANHDSRESFYTLEKWLRSRSNIKIAYQPEIVTLHTREGYPVQIAALPGIDKGHFLANNPGLDAAAANQVCSDGLADIIRGFSAQIQSGMPAILAGHYTVTGAEYDNGNSVFMESEICLRPTDIDSSTFDLVCLGHIHKAQKVPFCQKPVFYSGSINALTFNDEGTEKGFWIHEFMSADETWTYKGSRFLKTPAREFLTLEPDQEQINDYLNGTENVTAWKPLEDYHGKIIRVRYTCNAETNKMLDKAKLEKDLYAAGAFWVQEIVPARITEELTRAEMDETMVPEQTLTMWMKAKEMPEEEIQILRGLAKPLIEEAGAKRPTGRLSGLFEPLHLEVKNYRSYQEQSFDFTKVRFATVNGPNGVGKSAFFMDAMYDCLFEEPREGELTGWISTNESARSGAIAFTFRMGNTIWRVSRSRTKGGKITLNLSEKVGEEWKDRSADKTVDTQQRIIDLLGMDGKTFKSCVLIMQDAYAVFLEADKTERMRILSNMLGMEVYEELEELAKKKITEVNREITATKAERVLLETKAANAAAVKDEIAKYKDELLDIVAQLDDVDAKECSLQAEVQIADVKMSELNQINQNIITLRSKYAAKAKEQTDIEAKLNDAERLLSQRDIIQDNVRIYEEMKTRITAIEATTPELTALRARKAQTELNIQTIKNKKNDMQSKLEEVNKTLSNADEIKTYSATYKELLKQVETLNDKRQEYTSKYNKAVELKHKADTTKALWDSKLQRLNDKITILERKTAMLDKVNCVDITKAKCEFLTDAIEAREQLQALRRERDEQRTISENEIQAAMEMYTEALKEAEAVKYDPADHERITKELERHKPYAELEAKIDGYRQTAQVLQEQIYSLDTQQKEAENTLTEIISRIRELEEKRSDFESLKATMNSLEKYVALKERLTAAEEVKKFAANRLTEIKAELDEITQEGQVLNKRKQDIESEIAGIESKKQKLQQIRTQKASLQDREKDLHSKIGGLKHQLQEICEAEEQAKEKNRAEQDLVRTVTRYQALAEAFSIDGIPFLITKAVVPELEAMANSILAQMTGGKMSIEMRTEKMLKSNKKEVNALEVWISTRDRGTMPYLSHSGGQRVKVALSVVFALANLKAKRAGVQLGMLFIDEAPFLDDEGTQAYADALETMARMFPQMRILSISHDPLMKARFLQTIQVVNTEQGSKILFENV
jgi:exonuclease SbcC